MSDGSGPAFNVADGGNHNLSGMTIYQNSASGKAFVSAIGTSYTIAATQVIGGGQSLGKLITSFAGAPSIFIVV